MKKVVIVGGGVAGLAAAHRLAELNRRFQKSFEIIVCEASSEWGGTIQTIRKNDFIMEEGPDCFIRDKPWGLDLCERLGLRHELISTREQFRRSFILHKNKLVPVPAGLYLTIPTNWKAFWNLPGVSLRGKMRMLWEVFVPKKTETKDESIGEFIRRRFGNEILEKMAQPMIAGIYSANPEKLSVLSTFPKLKKMESEKGSLLRAFLIQKDPKRKSLSEASGPRYSLFVSFRKGMQTLIDALVSELSAWKDPGLNIYLKTREKVSKILWNQKKWLIETDSEKWEADAVLLAIPSEPASHLIRNFSDDLADKVKSISYEPITTLNLIYQRNQIGHPLDGFGFVVPATQKSSLIACSFSSVKFEGRAPEEKVLLRAFIKGRSQDKKEEALSMLKKVLLINDEPIETHSKDYFIGLPQYEVGHLQKIKDIETERLKYPHFYLTGNAYLGSGIPDVVYQAEEAARQIIEGL